MTLSKHLVFRYINDAKYKFVYDPETNIWTVYFTNANHISSNGYALPYMEYGQYEGYECLQPLIKELRNLWLSDQ